MSICFSGSLSLWFISFLVPYICFVHSWLNKLIDWLTLRLTNLYLMESTESIPALPVVLLLYSKRNTTLNRTLVSVCDSSSNKCCQRSRVFSVMDSESATVGLQRWQQLYYDDILKRRNLVRQEFKPGHRSKCITSKPTCHFFRGLC